MNFLAFCVLPDKKLYGRGHQRRALVHLVARRDHVGRPRVSSKNNISMINVFTNINIMKGKLNNFYFRSA